MFCYCCLLYHEAYNRILRGVAQIAGVGGLLKWTAGLVCASLVPLTVQAGVVIDEDFSAGASSFTAIAGGTWGVSSGTYQLTSPATGGVALLGNISVHDTAVTDSVWEVRVVGNVPENGNTWNDFAVVFNYQDSNNYYYFIVNETNNENTSGIFKIEGGTPTELVDVTTLISSDTDYTLTVKRNGSSIFACIDGTEVASVSDATFTGGKVGIGSKNDAVDFDDLRVVTGIPLVDEEFGTGASNFTVVSGGTWGVSSGEYALTSPATGGVAMLGNISVQDTAIPHSEWTVSVMGNVPENGNTWNDFAVVFNYQDSNNYYYFIVNETNNENTSGVFKVEGGTPTELADVTTLISSDTDYRLTVQRDGTSIIAYIDDTQVASLTDVTFTGGKVGVGSKNDVVYFDDLLVTMGVPWIDEDFSVDDSDFTVVSGGTWGVSSGEYVLTSPATGGVGLLGNISVHNTVISGSAWIAGVVGNVTENGNTWNDFALVFNYQDSSNFYYFIVNESNNENTSGVFKVVSGTPTELADVTTLISSGTDYTLTVQRDGSSIVAYIDDTEVASLTDATFTGGQVGVGSKNDTVYFDDLLVIVDNDAPSVPTGLVASNVTATSVDLDWNPSADNVGVVGYYLYTGGSNPVSVSGTSVTVTGLTASTSYTFTVSAYDATGNESSQSSGVIVTTAASSGDSYYVDPASGSMSNPGTSAEPWSTLQAVFSAGKTFDAGDIIYLRDGYHGYPTITGTPSGTGTVTIRPQSGHSPTAKKVIFNNASNFILTGLEISPEVVSSYEKGNFVTINQNCSDIEVSDCFIYSTLDSSGWSTSNWLSRAGHGIVCQGEDCVITGNHLFNLSTGIQLRYYADNSVASYNTVENYCLDGIQMAGCDYPLVEYNIIMNSYDVGNGNHDDAIQAWSDSDPTQSCGPDCGEGMGTTTGGIIRGNVIMCYTDPSQPHPSTNSTVLGGIAMFGGWYDEWVIENNIVCVDTWNGIALYGGIDCKVINNTVIPNPIAIATNGPPWIHVRDHKYLGDATGNLIRNNLTSQMEITDATVGTYDHNIVTTDYDAHFVYYDDFDFHLKSTSGAVDAGSSSAAPGIDFEGDSRDAIPDVGADEYVPAESAVTGLFPRAAAFEQNWYWVNWIGAGWFNAEHFPWIVHVQHGWWWCGNATSETYWVYDMEMGWLYIDPGFSDFCFSQNLATWLYYSLGSGSYSHGRKFYNFNTHEWIMV